MRVLPRSGKAGKARAPRSEVNPTKSIALKNLPDWSHTLFEDKRGGSGVLVSTLVDIYGAQINPWDLDHETSGGDLFLKLVQIVVDYLAPARHYEVTKNCQIYRRVSGLLLVQVTGLISTRSRRASASTTGARTSKR